MLNREPVRTTTARGRGAAIPRAFAPVGAALLLAIALAALCAVARPVRADAFTYSSQRRQVRAAILVSSATNMPGRNGKQTPENPDPHVFYVLDSRNDLKPVGMEFVNPLAPPVITASIYQRWYDRDRQGGDPAFAAGSIFQVGARVTKNMGAYWEANLDNLTADDLQQFDLLFIHTHKPNVAFPPDQLEKLRKFVEAGGTLWVDDCGGFTFAPGAPFLMDVQYNNGGNSQSQISIGAPNHPLVSYPYVLSPQEISNFGDKARNDYFVYDASSNTNPVPGKETMVPVVWNTRGQASVNPITPGANWRAYVLAGQLGAGRIIICSEDSGCAINDYVGGYNAGYGGNSGALSGQVLIGAHPVDLKFAYNLASWTSAQTTALSDVHRTSGSRERIAPKLVQQWTPSGVGTPASPKTGGVAFFRHCVYSVDGNLILHCYDSNPAEDLDGDGNPDDGIPDFLGGTACDEVWNVDLKQYANGATGASAPTVIEFYDPAFANAPQAGDLLNFQLRQLVVVVMNDGTVLAFRAFPQHLVNNRIVLSPLTALDWKLQLQGMTSQDYGISTDPGTSPLAIPSAAFNEGVLFVSLNTTSGGRVAALDPRWGKSVFHCGPDGTTGAMDPGATGTTPEEALVPSGQTATTMPPVIGTPSVGYVRDAGTGASDKLVYVHVAAATNGISQSMAQTVRSFWFSTKGEPLTFEGGTNFRSRSVVPWFIVDPANPGILNPALRQRVFAKYTDPATGAVTSQELTYVASAPTSNQYTVTFPPGRPVQVTLGTPVLGHDPSEEGVTIYANYTEDWSSSNTSTARANSRSTFVAPDPTASGATLGGSPSLSPDDVIYFTAATVSPAATGNNALAGVVFAVNEQPAPRSALKWAYTVHNGFTFQLNDQTITVPPRLRMLDPIYGPLMGQPITDVQFFGTPAYKDNVVYAVAKGSCGGLPVSLLCAFSANPDMTLRLGQAVAPGTRVRIGQINVVTSSSGQQLTPVWLVENQNYTVNYGSGLVHITSMAPLGSVTNFVSASMPFIVQIGNNPMQVIAGAQHDADGTVRMVGPDGVDNLLWYMVLPAALPPGLSMPSPGAVSSSPSVQGDALWLGTIGGYVASFDADPSARDPQFQMKGSQVQLFTGAYPHLRWWAIPSNAMGLPPQPVMVAPQGSEGVLAVACASGVVAYGDDLTVVADAKRLVEVNSAGEAVWTCDGTRSYSVAGGDLPQFLVDPNGVVNPVNPANATGVPTVHRVPFARPSVVRRIALNDFVVVDTGNNRVVQIDRGGNVEWEVTRLLDDYKHLLRPGDPLTLNEPADCSYWTDYNPTGINYAYQGADGNNHTVVFNGPVNITHYLIADTGNFRIIEVVDVYDMNGRPVQPLLDGQPAPFNLLRQLNFVSGTTAMGKQYRYRSALRTYLQNGTPLTLAIVSNAKVVGTTAQQYNPLGENQEAGGGSVVVLDATGQVMSVVSSLRIPDPNVPNKVRAQQIMNPTWFSSFWDLNSQNQPVRKYLLADANGCYQLAVNEQNPQLMDVEWMLSADDYYWMTGKRLYAASIERLTSSANNANIPRLHQFLISNRFSGQDDPTVFGQSNVLAGEFHGEAFQVSPTTFAWASPHHGYNQDYVVAGNSLAANGQASIVWRSPSETVRSTPVGFFFYRSIGDANTASSTSLLEQPAFADRPF